MRKRSKYRPKGVFNNPLAYVLEGLTPVAQHGSYLLDLKIKNHAALAALTQGKATRQDIDTLIAAFNITEALYRMGFGTEYANEVRGGQQSLLAVGQRGAKTGRFVLYASEILALNTVMELHDAQMDVITVKDMERAVQLVQREYKLGRMTRIKPDVAEADPSRTAG